MDKDRFNLSLEVKSLQEDGSFAGYAAVFNNVDLVGEIIEKGAFAKALRGKKTLPLLWNHDQSDVIGSVKKAKEDDNGLWVEGKLNLALAKGLEVYSMLKNGDVEGMSIGYLIKKRDTDAKGITHLRELMIFEASITAIPANPMASVVHVKSTDINTEEDADMQKEMEAYNTRLKLLEYEVSGIKSLCLEIKSLMVTQNTVNLNTDDNEFTNNFKEAMAEFKNCDIFRK